MMVLICILGSFLIPTFAETNSNNEIQTSGLIYRYNLSLSKKNNTTVIINGLTDCDPVVVKCGFKNLKVQRRANSSSSWTDYHDYGNDYIDSFTNAICKELSVDPGYQYRATCIHYAKKNILNTQTISNTSNVVTF
jgi:hypothetical protein